MKLEEMKRRRAIIEEMIKILDTENIVSLVFVAQVDDQIEEDHCRLVFNSFGDSVIENIGLCDVVKQNLLFSMLQTSPDFNDECDE